MEASSEAFQRRKRMMVQAILSPPRVIPLDHGDVTYQGPKGYGIGCQDKKDVECYLCHGRKTGDAPPPALGVIMSVMSQFGLFLEDGELTFCTFCCSQLRNLVSLKQEADRTSQRLSTMVVGLHALVAMSTPPPQAGDVLAKENEALDKTLDGTTYFVDFDDAVDIDIKEEAKVGDGGRRQSSEEDEDTRASLNPDRFTDEATTTPSYNVIAESWQFVPSSRLVQKTMKRIRGRVSCDLCDKTFTNKLTLKQHQTVHTGQRSHPCPQCPYRSTTKRNLDRHSETHRPPEQRNMPFQCSRCPRRFPENYKLQTHLKVHRVPANKRTWQCALCCRTFGNKAILNNHVTVSHQYVGGEERATPPCNSSTFGDNPSLQSLQEGVRGTNLNQGIPPDV